MSLEISGEEVLLMGIAFSESGEAIFDESSPETLITTSLPPLLLFCSAIPMLLSQQMVLKISTKTRLRTLYPAVTENHFFT